MKRFLVVLLFIASTLAVPLENQHFEISAVEDFGSRIVNGKNAVPGQFPWQALIYAQKKNGGRWWCGGSLISTEWILTGAHQIQDSNALEIYLGITSRSDPNATALFTNNYLIHESFNPTTMENDIGLVHLYSAVKLSSTISIVALSDVVVEAGLDVTTSGWGYTTSNPDTPDALKYIELTTITNSQCASNPLNINITSGMMCALGWAFRSICDGDTGGALIIKSGGVPLQVGIASWPVNRICETGKPSGFTSIRAYRAWIKQWTGI